MKTKILSFFTYIFLCSSFFLISLFFQVRIDATNERLPGEDLKYLPSGKFLKGAALCYDEVLADLLWIKAIGYFGEHYVADQNYAWLYHLLDITTSLDPGFEDPYEFGGIILAGEMGNIDQSTELLKKGMNNVFKHHKRYWYLPFFVAFNYMYYKGDNLNAARYLEIAARYPQSPSYLPLLVSRLYANSDDPVLAIPFLEEMIRKTNSPELQKKLRKRIKEIMVERDIRFLEKGRDQFLAQTGRYPNTLDELVQGGFIQNIPEEPFGGTYTIEVEDHSIRSSMTERLKLHINEAGGSFLKR